MEELTLVQKFDTVLDALYEISGKRPTFKRIMALLRVRKMKIEWGEVWDIIIKMKKDGLVHPDIQDSSSKIPLEVIHLITIDGKMMKETGGMKGKLERQKIHWTQKHPLIYAVLTGLGAATLSLIAGVIQDRVSKQSENKEIQEIKQTAKEANQKVDSVIGSLKNKPSQSKVENVSSKKKKR